MSVFSVRNVRNDDIPDLITVFRASIRVIASRDYTHDQVMAWAPDEIDAASWAKRYDTRQAWVAELDSVEVDSMRARIVGFIELEGRDHLDMMYVHPAHQRRGVATALLNSLEVAARERGAKRLRTEASITARPFFERRGFLLIAAQEVAFRGQRFLNFRMEKPLADPN